MFETNDEIDVDDDFLNGVFENEQENVNVSISMYNNYHQASDQSQQCQNVLLIEDNKQIRPIPILTNKVGYNQPASRSEENQFNNLNNSSKTEQDSRHILQGIKSNKDNSLLKHHSNVVENKRKYDSPVPSRVKRERKFPGPAGLLPDRSSFRNSPLKLDSLLEDDQSSPNSTIDDLCSQGRCSGSVLEEEPWQTLVTDLGPDRDILDTINVATVKRKAAARCFMGRKVPFLAAVLHHLDGSSPDPCIILRDKTGEIHGTLHREVWELFAGELVVGSVLVIRNVGLLSTGISSRRHYLNITANNLVTIYSASSEKSGRTKANPFKPKDFLQIIENWRTLVSPSHTMRSSPAGSLGSPSLFNTSFCSPAASNPLTTSQRPSNTKPQGMNTRPMTATAQGARFSTSENSPRHQVPPRPVGKNLMSSFVPSPQHSSSVGNVTSNLPCSSRSLSNATQINSCQNRVNRPSSSSVNSSLNCPVMGNNSFRNQNKVPTSNFDFKPVINKPKHANQSILQHIGSPNQLSSEFTNNNSKLVLSQSSQLTAEEQSLVESVFEGIDADSLFEDDF